MKAVLKGVGVSLLVFLFFCLMSRIDFIVHGILYNYGLHFSYQWANEYWYIYTAVFVVFSIVIGVIYWVGSNKTKKDLKVSMGLATTVNLLLIGGLADILVFVLWAGGLPSDNIVWWWMPWYHILGIWTSSMQIILMALMSLIVSILWILILGVKRHTSEIFLLSDQRDFFD